MSCRIGFVGLGIMGRPMSKSLLKARHKLVVYDIVPAAVDEVVEAGAERGSSAGDVASRSDIIITMLPDGPEVEQAVLGPGGVLEGAKAGSLVIDMSSISPHVAQKVGAACEAKGVDFLDAPVSGGEPRAIHGTLAIMAGGRKEAFARAEPVLQAMGSYVTLTGPIGAGNITKLANQIMVAVNIAAMGEALVLATKAGLNPEIVFEAVKGGLAGSTVLNFKAPMVIQRNFLPGFRISLHHKDLRNAIQAAESLGISLPLTGVVQEMLVSLVSDGKGDLDHSAIVQYLEQSAGVEVRKPN